MLVMAVGELPTVKRLRTPAAWMRDCAAAMGLGCSPAWTLRMHTARGTFTTLLPTAAVAPATNATAPGTTFLSELSHSLTKVLDQRCAKSLVCAHAHQTIQKVQAPRLGP